MFRLLDLLFGCPHRRYTFPLTPKGGQRRLEAARATGTYVVCLNCAREFAYDWREMKVISRSPRAAGVMADASAKVAERAA